METSVSYILRSRRNAERRRRRRRKLILRWTLVLSVTAVLIFLITQIVTVVLFFGNVRAKVALEAGGPVPAAAEFLRRPSKKVQCLTDLSQIDSKTPGTVKVVFKRGLLKKSSVLEIKDTTAPALKVQDVTRALGQTVQAEDFVVSAEDISEVKVSFAAEPDFSREGEQTVKITAADASGNRAEAEAKLQLVGDTEAPVITGAKDMTVEVGETISYKADITVTDDKDPAPKLEVDNSAVDPDKPGTYEVTYKATDAAGNSSSVTVKVTVKEKEKEPEDAAKAKMNQLADGILKKILKDEMSQIEKAFAIWRWVRLNVPWIGGNVEHDPVDQAIKGLSGHSGDCYTDTCACQALLERAGFECKFMQRSPGIGYHYWLMVKIGDDWYHMDPAPIYIKTFICFLGTDDQLQWFTDTQRPNYYTHDTEGLPKTPKEPAATAVYKDGDYQLVLP